MVVRAILVFTESAAAPDFAGTPVFAFLSKAKCFATAGLRFATDGLDPIRTKYDLWKKTWTDKLGKTPPKTGSHS